MKLSIKIPTFAIGMIIAALLVISGLTIIENSAYNERISYDQIIGATKDMESRIEELLERSEQNAVSIAQNYYLIRAMENNDFNQMQASLDALNTYLQTDTISITDANGDVLIRQHSPEKYGDSILNQSNVQHALEGKIATTIEPGALVKLSCRTGAPIRGEDGKNHRNSGHRLHLRKSGAGGSAEGNAWYRAYHFFRYREHFHHHNAG